MVTNNRKILLLIGVSLFMFGLLLFVNKQLEPKNEIEVGQVYKYVEDNKNPFEEDIVHYQIIIPVKGDYVLYYDELYKDTVSIRKSLFLYNAELIK